MKSAYDDLMVQSLPPFERPKPRDPVALYQASAIPYKLTREDLLICLITSRKKQRWGFPKASTEGFGTVEAAMLAAHHKAGVSGELSDSPIGRYRHLKYGNVCEVSVYGMEVKEDFAAWPEQRLRSKKWIRASATSHLLVKPELQDMLEWLRRTLGTHLAS